MIKVTDLKHRWHGDDDWALHIPQLDIRKGEKVAIIGESGCGKSTFLSILSGLTAPTEGEIWVNGEAIHRASVEKKAAHRATQLSWQGAMTPPFSTHSVLENLFLTAQSLGEKTSEQNSKRDLDKLSHLLMRFGLNPDITLKSPRELSQGERQRIEVLKVCLSTRPLLMFDEPSSHLNHSRAMVLIEAMMSCFSEEQTVIIVTHDLKLAAYCDRVIDLDHPLLIGPTHTHDSSSKHSELPSTTEFTSDEHIFTQSHLRTLKRDGAHPWGFALRQLTASLKFYLVLILASLIAMLIPTFIEASVHQAKERMLSRAQESPLIVAAINGEQQLFFSGLYFTNAPVHSLTLSKVEEVLSMGFGEGSPIIIAPRVIGHPLVGTDASYYRWRRLSFVQGRIPHIAGEVVMSQRLARSMGLVLGDRLQTEVTELFDLTSPYPIELNLVGLFKSDHIEDEEALFTTLATAWASLGFAHSHRKAIGSLDASIAIDQQLSLDDLHLHGDLERLPISVLLMHSESPKDQSLLKARLRKDHRNCIAFSPQKIAEETLKSVEVFHRGLRPLISILVAAMITLITLMLIQRHLSQSELRNTLSVMGLNPTQVLLISLREYALFIFVLMLAFSLLWIAIQYIASDAVFNLALSALG